ncbi:MAG: hypothetical protein GTO63_20905, partial [Anaerolineae bacterium]|nr:hypothetical protein [Anaerolineae bacterium]NIN97240.1 hypothetical protein [Anaerolineae bacterium]
MRRALLVVAVAVSLLLGAISLLVPTPVAAQAETGPMADKITFIEIVDEAI